MDTEPGTAVQDAAAILDQLSTVSAHVDTAGLELGDVASALTIVRHDPATIGEALAVMDTLAAAAERSEEARRAAVVALEQILHHNELMGGLPGEGLEAEAEAAGEDELVTREWYLLTFHESGHAMWSALSKYLEPLRMDGLEVQKRWFKPPSGTGFVESERRRVMFGLMENRNPPTDRELLDWTASALAGSVSEANWMSYMENADFEKALRYCYSTGGSSDYRKALSYTGGNRKTMLTAEDMARGLVADNWAGIMDMAKLAREQERLSARDITKNA
jgi:hypothetical protein